MKVVRDIAALFFAEARVRRLVRWHVFAFILFAFVVASYLALASLHYYAPNASVYSGAYSPRFAVPVMGELWIWITQVGVFFLLFDRRARERADGIDDLLRVRPIGPGSRTIAALLATTTISWTALVAALLLVQSFAFLSQLLSVHGASTDIWWLAVPMEGASVAGFLLLDALPTLFLVGALTQLVSAIVKPRFIVAVCFFLAFFMYIFFLGSQPVGLSEGFATVSRYGVSDLIFSFTEKSGLVRSAGYVMMGVALCCAAIVVADGMSVTRRHVIVGAVFGFISCLLLVGLAKGESRTLGLRKQWLAALQEAVPSADIDVRHIEGTIVLEPGERMVVDVVLDLATRTTTPTSKVTLALNPGLVVEELSVDGKPAAYRQGEGLLELDRESFDTELITLSVRAVGIPDERYSYLDDERDWRLDTRSSSLILLGTKASIYDKEYVALMPTVAWLPMAPASLAGHTTDFFSMDIVVHAPHDWSVVATGDRVTMSGGGRHRFVSANPVPRVALFAGPLVRNALVVRGVEFELFMSKEHVREALYFEDLIGIEGGVADYAAAMLDRAQSIGLPYPYKQLRFVEVPAELRTYGGGWRKDTQMVEPSILLVHEYAFPTRRYRRPPSPLGEDFSDVERDRVSALLSTFTFNLQGGNYHQLGRNLFLFETSSHGQGTAVIDQLCLELTIDLMWPGRRVLEGKIVSLGGFSAHQYASDEFGISVGPFFRNLREGRLPNQVAVAGDDPGTWERMQHSAVIDLPTSEAGQGVDLLLLRTRLMRETIFSHLGFDEVANVLAELRRRYRGRTFATKDFVLLLERKGMPKGILDNWLSGTKLPGFVFSEVLVEEISGDVDEEFYLSVHIRNGEPVPGAFRLMYDQRVGSADWHWRDSDVTFVEADAAVEVGFSVPELPSEVWLDSFLSMNRRPARLHINRSFSRGGERERLVGTRTSYWHPNRPSEEMIFVDDQDDGFLIQGTSGRDLPWYGREGYSGGWAREEQATAWGRYFRTVVRTRTEGVAEFVVELPGGPWNLDYHLPDIGVRTWGYTRRSRGDKHGIYRFRVAATDFAEEFALAPLDAEAGWNRIGSFELPEGKVSVVVSNGESDGASTIYADAVRWSRKPLDLNQERLQR